MKVMKEALAIWGIVTVASVAADVLWARTAPILRASRLDGDERGVIVQLREPERVDR